MASRSAFRKPSRSQVNLALVLLVVVLTALWFYRHLYTMVAVALIPGTVISVAALWKLVVSFLPKKVSVDRPSLVERIIVHPRATLTLLIAAVGAGGLLATTSSIYVEHDGVGGRVEIVIERNGEPAGEPEALTAHARFVWRIYPFGFGRLLRSERVTIRVLEPDLYEVWPGPSSAGGNLSAWSAIHVRVPSEIRPREFRVLRLAPVAMALQKLALRVDDDDRSAYEVALRLGKDEYVLRDYLLATVYVSSRPDVLAAARAEDDSLHFKQVMHNGLLEQYQRVAGRAPAAPVLQARAWLLCNTTRDWFLDREPIPGEMIRVEVRVGGTLDAVGAGEVAKDAGIQTVLLKEASGP